MEMRITCNRPVNKQLNKLHRAYELEELIKQQLVTLNHQVTELRELGHIVAIGLKDEQDDDSSDWHFASDCLVVAVDIELQPVGEATKLAS
jgi:hypothetical protein